MKNLKRALEARELIVENDNEIIEAEIKISMGGRARGVKSCREEQMELCFERGRDYSMHPSYVRLQNNQCVRKESSKSRGRSLEKGEII